MRFLVHVMFAFTALMLLNVSVALYRVSPSSLAATSVLLFGLGYLWRGTTR